MAATEIVPQAQAEPMEPTTIIDPRARQDATGRAERIRHGMGDITALLKVAFDSNDHLALGYRDWKSYLDGEFGEDKLPARRELVALMSGQGMSERAIAAATGIDKSVVHRDKTASGGEAPQVSAAERKKRSQIRRQAEADRVTAVYKLLAESATEAVGGAGGIMDEARLAHLTGVRPARVSEIIRSTPASRQAARVSAERAAAGVEPPAAPFEGVPRGLAPDREPKPQVATARPSGPDSEAQSPWLRLRDALPDREHRELLERMVKSWATEIARLRADVTKVIAERDSALQRVAEAGGDR